MFGQFQVEGVIVRGKSLTRVNHIIGSTEGSRTGDKIESSNWFSFSFTAALICTLVLVGFVVFVFFA